MAVRTRASVADEYQLDPARALAAVLFHPVVQDAAHAGRQTEAVLDAVQAEGYQAVCLLPNADAGNSLIREVILRRCASVAGFHVVTHLPRRDYVSLIASADLLIGNSSSGIVEAASFGTPVVNIGDRQYARERNPNVFDAPPQVAAIRAAIRKARQYPREDTRNLYGDGGTSARVADLLAGMAIDAALFKKTNTY
ncbi:MAG: UDP-N-acetylglucosamine 2-epimerase (hydrolyzing), partial [Zoogloea sp.]|nr:UDP-N-acetylglucosamine 2-epimerase (hydrolyzing) [Zoogloea sp.]